MKHLGKLAGVSALAVVLLAGSPVSADPELKNSDLRKELRELRDELAALRKLQAASARAADLELRLLNERLDRIENALSRLSADRSTRTASSFTPAAPAGTGTLRLDNRLAVPATVVIDGVVYQVPAFSTQVQTNRPAGAITYEVTAVGYGVRAPVRTPLAAGETLTLTIF
jgi:hypothetical protein